MALEPWPEIDRRHLLSFKVFHVLEARRRSPRTGAEHRFFLIDTLDWVNIVAFTPGDEIVMVRQYRHGPQEFTLELPGGCVDPGEDPAAAAARELREESGFAPVGEPRLIGCVRPNPALFTNRCFTYLFDRCLPAGELRQDPGEDLEVVTVPVAEIERRVAAGEIDHALVLNALYFWRLTSGD